MDRCFDKNSQLDNAFRTLKARVVFRGDQIKDDQGFNAIYYDACPGASQMSTAKFVDAIATMPGRASEDTAAMGACMQVCLVCMSDHIEAWIYLPPFQRPDS